MAKLIFVNLPIADLARATAFYEAIGAVKNAQFSDDTGSCMVFSETIHAMLLTHDKFRQFTPKKIADAKTSSEVLICISADNRGAVDFAARRALLAGLDALGPEEWWARRAWARKASASLRWFCFRASSARRRVMSTESVSEAAAQGQRMPGGPSRWNATKDLSWEPLRIERVCEVEFEGMMSGRFRHNARFRRCCRATRCAMR